MKFRFNNKQYTRVINLKGILKYIIFAEKNVYLNGKEITEMLKIIMILA